MDRHAGAPVTTYFTIHAPITKGYEVEPHVILRHRINPGNSSGMSTRHRLRITELDLQL